MIRGGDWHTYVNCALIASSSVFGWAMCRAVLQRLRHPGIPAIPASAGCGAFPRCAGCRGRAASTPFTIASHPMLFAAPGRNPVSPQIPTNVPPGVLRGTRSEESEPGAEHRQKLGLLLALIAFGIAIAAGVGFIYVYWTSASNRLLGGTMALSFGGFGAAVVLWARWLIQGKEATEEREPLPSGEETREAVLRTFYPPDRPIQRRGLLKWLSVGVGATFLAMIVSTLRSFFGEPTADILMSTVWVRGQELFTTEGNPVSINTLEPGSSVVVFPRDRMGSVEAETILIRVDPQSLQLPKERATWAPMGYVAYSRICTHAGCPVGEFQSGTDLLLCPCHQSTFNVLKAAEPTGGPAARPLPQLPLYVDADGHLRAGGPFTQPPGPGFWSMPS